MFTSWDQKEFKTILEKKNLGTAMEGATYEMKGDKNLPLMLTSLLLHK